MVVRVQVNQQETERNVARLDAVVHGAIFRVGRRCLLNHHVPRRLSQEHDTHVAAPCRFIIVIELVDRDLWLWHLEQKAPCLGL